MRHIVHLALEESDRSVPKYRQDLEGIPAYKPGLPIADAVRQFGIDDVIKLASNECPTGPFPEVAAAISAAIPEVNRYPDSASGLSQAIADHHHVGAHQVLVSPGSSATLLAIALAVGTRSTSVVYPHPSFALYQVLTSFTGSRPVEVPLDTELRIDPEAMIAAVEPDTTLLYYCNPNNPTGTHNPPEAAIRIVNSVSDRVMIVIDEAYEEYVTAPDHTTAIPHAIECDNVVVTRTFSKLYGLAGLRIGYAIGQANTLQALRRLQLPFATSSLATTAAQASLALPGLAENRRRENAVGRQKILTAMKRLGVRCYDSQTNFVLIDPPADPGVITQRLLERGVIVRQFGKHIRVTVGTPSENIRFATTLEHVIGTAASEN